jgi:non-specific serine/threonine protein kinase
LRLAASDTDDLVLRIRGKQWTIAVAGQTFHLTLRDLVPELANPARVLQALESTVAANVAERTPRRPPGSRASEQSDGVAFCRRDDVWKLTYDGTTTLLRHGRGIALLACLFRQPGRHIHVRELETATRGVSCGDVSMDRSLADHPTTGELGDHGPMLDARAKREYRRHLTDLDDQIAAAEERHDLGRVDALLVERGVIAKRLRAAVGLGGRDRRTGSAVERMRVAITRRIRAAIRQIAIQHPGLGAHLMATVRTGYRCAYIPDR